MDDVILKREAWYIEGLCVCKSYLKGEFENIKLKLEKNPHIIDYINFELIENHPDKNFEIYTYLLKKKNDARI